MLKPSIAVVVVAVLAAVAACEGDGNNDTEPKNEGEGEPGEGEGEGEEGEGEGEGEEGEGEGEGEDDCDLAAVIDDEVVIPASCSPLLVDHTVTVGQSGSLTFSPGLTVRFDDDTGLDVFGDLIAAGTAEDAIVIESGGSAAAGAWRGVSVFGAADSVVFEHVTVRHGGQLGDDLLAGCLTLDTVADDVVSVTDSTFEDCAGAGFASFASSNLGAFDANTFVRCPLGMDVQGGSVASISGNQVFTDTPRILVRLGFVARSGTWAAQALPWELGSSLVVDGVDQPTLTLAAQTLRFAAETSLVVGGKSGGALVADDVVFEAVDDGAGWVGLDFAQFTGPSTLTSVTVNDADVGVGLSETGANVTISDSTFADNGVDIFVDCDSTPVLTGNTATVQSEGGC
jgi:hypothetical protein